VSRIEQIGDCTLYMGNCLEIMPTLGCVDHTIADPPYEDELHNAVGKFARLRSDGKDYKSNNIESFGFNGINSTRADVAKIVTEITNGWAILFTLAEGVRAWRDDLQAVKAKWDTTLAWVKPDASPRFNGQGAARGFENAVTCWCGPGYRGWNAGGKRGIYTHCVNTNRHGEHPTEKPVPLMVEILSDYTNPGQTILDPFMGSGTTGVACVKLGRKFIGIELEEKYFDIACERIQKAYDQPDMFVAPPEKLKQAGLDI